MNSEQLQTYLAALASSLTINVIVPLVLFIIIFLGLVWVTHRAQKSGKLEVSQFLQETDGKASFMRIAGGVALAAMTWVMAVEAINGRLTHELFFVYGFTWSGALVFVRLADKWNGSLPWAK